MGTIIFLERNRPILRDPKVTWELLRVKRCDSLGLCLHFVPSLHFKPNLQSVVCILCWLLRQTIKAQAWMVIMCDFLKPIEGIKSSLQHNCIRHFYRSNTLNYFALNKDMAHFTSLRRWWEPKIDIRLVDGKNWRSMHENKKVNSVVAFAS